MAVGTFVADVGLFVIDAPMLIGLLQESVAAKIVGVNPASRFYVPHCRPKKCSLRHVRLQLEDSPRSAALYT